MSPRKQLKSSLLKEIECFTTSVDTVLQAHAPSVIIRQQQTVLLMIVEQQHPLPLVLKHIPLPTAAVDAPSARASIATVI